MGDTESACNCSIGNGEAFGKKLLNQSHAFTQMLHAYGESMLHVKI
jgi:hypothetical protein